MLQAKKAKLFRLKEEDKGKICHSKGQKIANVVQNKSKGKIKRGQN